MLSKIRISYLNLNNPSFSLFRENQGFILAFCIVASFKPESFSFEKHTPNMARSTLLGHYSGGVTGYEGDFMG